MLNSKVENAVDCSLWHCFRKMMLTKPQIVMMGYYWKLRIVGLEENCHVSEKN